MLEVHRHYPGVALVVTERGSVLLGAPTDAFKATKSYCLKHQLPFPRILVAPRQMLVRSAPQFSPEFFLYDFLFVYGAALKPGLQGERLQLILDPDQVESTKAALRITLMGPTREEMESYTDPSGQRIVPDATVNFLATIGEYMAIKKSGLLRSIDDMVEAVTFDRDGKVRVLADHLIIERNGPHGFLVRQSDNVEMVDLSVLSLIVPFAELPVPSSPQRPLSFGVKNLGTRSGFDLTGPSTGFIIWVNGRVVVYDGPVGTRYLLERQGISCEDIDVVVLSHCHEDHMGAFIELVLSGQRPRVYTTETIYRSALVKLSTYFNQPVEEVATYIDYHHIAPGQPVHELGAEFVFFYTVHAIPTIGMSVTYEDESGLTHKVVISGDTLHHDGLDTLREMGMLPEPHYENMRHLVPDERIPNAVYFCDVGESIIHGHPKDWQDNSNRILYYHCPDNAHTRSFGRELAVPGQTLTLAEPRRIYPAIPARLLNALRFLEIDDPSWFATMLFRGRSRYVEPDEILVTRGSPTKDTFSIVVSGSATIHLDEDTEPGKVHPVLRPGEFFGLIELVDEAGNFSATLRAATPMELFDIDAALFREYVVRHNLQDTLERTWRQRPMVDSTAIFRDLDIATRNHLARIGQVEEFSAGDHVLDASQGQRAFHLLIEGEVGIEEHGEVLASIYATAEDNFVGITSTLMTDKPTTRSVIATTNIKTLRFSNTDIRKLYEENMRVRYALDQALRLRNIMTKMPTSPG